MPNGTPPGLPGANILAVVMAAPTDLMNLATRNMQDVMSVFNAGVQRFTAAAAVPPAPPTLPAGFLPAGFPLLPGMPGAAAAPGGGAPPAPAPAPKTTTVYGGEQAMPLYRVTVQT